MFSGRIDHHGCMEVVIQGLRAHSDSFLAAMWLECYVLLHYFERARGHKGWILEPGKHGPGQSLLDRTSVLPREN